MIDLGPSERARLAGLLTGALRPPPGRGRIAYAFCVGAIVHALFGAAVLAMIAAMFFGMTESLGAVPWPWAGAVNALLLLQFPLGHSFLLTRRGGRVLGRLMPRHGAVLSSSTYALVASLQLLALFLFWTPTGIVWWRAEGLTFGVICGLYAASWLLLIKSTAEAGIDVQSGALGWLSLLAKRAPKFPDMPTRGLFRLIRQPIYVSFALTTWTVPVWSPDQLAVALSLTAYCLIAPIHKERRFAKRYGADFAAYKARTPYAFPNPLRKTQSEPDPTK